MVVVCANDSDSAMTLDRVLDKLEIVRNTFVDDSHEILVRNTTC